MHFPAQFGDAHLGLEQVLSRDTAECTDVSRLHEVDLSFEIRPAVLALLRARRAVVRRPALQRIANVDLFPFEPAGFDDLVEQLPSPADERLPLGVLVGTRGLA